MEDNKDAFVDTPLGKAAPAEIAADNFDRPAPGESYTNPVVLEGDQAQEALASIGSAPAMAPEWRTAPIMPPGRSILYTPGYERQKAKQVDKRRQKNKQASKSRAAQRRGR